MSTTTRGTRRRIGPGMTVGTEEATASPGTVGKISAASEDGADGGSQARALARRRLLAWYDRHRRDLPWRARPGQRPADPYHVWLSEIMLQQTTVAAVIPYFARFLSQWPRIEDLAAADLDEVLVAWQGLGYYARARNLHACARAVAEAGGLPQRVEDLRQLPGVGAYTAAAIAAIAFDRPAAPVDGNVVRVLARFYGVETELPSGRNQIEALAQALTPSARSGDFAQALMDLGATVCTPRAPACLTCPWSGPCRAHATGDPERYPRKPARKARPIRHGVAFWTEGKTGTVLLRRRPPRGLLGGMMEVPSTPWRPQPWPMQAALSSAPVRTTWQPRSDVVGHTFTHFHLWLTVMVGRAPDETPDETGTDGGIWVPIDALDTVPLPTVMRKVAASALALLSRKGPMRRPRG